MHNKMVEKVMRAKILFFDSNPIGRITTRFTKDMMITDTMISNYAIFVSMFFFRILFVFITVIIVNPYLLIVFAISSIFVYRVANLGIHPMIECQKFEQMYFAPINTTLNTMINGITTLRSYRKFDYYKQNFNDALEKSSNATFGFIIASRWLSTRLDIICTLIAFSTAVLAIILKDVASKELLVMSLQIVTDIIQFFGLGIRFIAELQNFMACP